MNVKVNMVKKKRRDEPAPNMSTMRSAFWGPVEHDDLRNLERLL